MPSNYRRLDAIWPRTYTMQNGQKGTEWLRVGSAFEGDKGIDLVLHALPLVPNERGEIRLMLREPRERQPQQQQQGGGYGAAQPPRSPEVQSRRQAPPEAAPHPADDPADDLPF